MKAFALIPSGRFFAPILAAGLTQVLSDGSNTYLYGAGRIAQVGANGPEYFLGDSLGSVRQLVDGSGAVIMAKGYEPYGQALSSDGNAQSGYGFTGEWTSSTNDLVYLRARWYVPSLFQFIQADTIAPNPYWPWEWNRYIYGINNPVDYVDPSGYEAICSDPDDCDMTLEEWASTFGVTFTGAWNGKRKTAAMSALVHVGSGMIGGARRTASEAFIEIFGELTFTIHGDGDVCEGGGHGFSCGVGIENDPRLFTHELGHTFNAVIVNHWAERLRDLGICSGVWESLSRAQLSVGPYLSLENAAITNNKGEWVTGKRPEGAFERTTRGYLSEEPPHMYHGPTYWSDWNTNENHTATREDFADMFTNWAYNSFDYRDEAKGAGIARCSWMDKNMPTWIAQATR